MSSTILELKESFQGVKKDLNLNVGVFDSILTPQLIEEGDIIQIKSGFIDTIQSSSGTIKIDDTNNKLTVSYVLMIQNYTQDAKIYNGYSTNDLPAGQELDNMPYIACKTENASPGSYEKLEYIAFYVIRKRTWSKFGYNTPVTFTYTDVLGNENVPLQAIIRETDTQLHEYDFSSSVIYKIGSLKLITSMDRIEKDAKVDRWAAFSGAYNPAGIHAVPFQQTVNFNIDNGTYEYAHLAKILTDKFTYINNRSGAFYTGNPASDNAFLMDTLDIRIAVGDMTAAGPFYVSTLGNGVFQMPTTQQYPDGTGGIIPGFETAPYQSYVGTDQVAFIYDEDLQKFTISQSHGSMYSLGTEITGSNPVEYNQDGTIISKSINKKIDGTSDYFSWTGRFGCIAFTSLEPLNFWFEGGIGLNPEICIQFEPHLVNSGIGNIPNISTFKVKGGLIDGIHTTNTFVGADAAISKNQFFYKSLSKTNLEVATTVNTVIYANKEMNAPSDDVGYLQIAIDGWKSNLFNEHDGDRSDIKAIVSRFYSNQGYTSFYNEGNTTQYIHTGPSYFIDKLRCRILKPDGEEASEILNSDNTVFIEIIRPNKNTIHTQIN
tara:strand:- start:1199 stop:3004 length:1806 start_codon:yes stop_codon:yes gene_type:complete